MAFNYGDEYSLVEDFLINNLWTNYLQQKQDGSRVPISAPMQNPTDTRVPISAPLNPITKPQETPGMIAGPTIAPKPVLGTPLPSPITKPAQGGNQAVTDTGTGGYVASANNPVGINTGGVNSTNTGRITATPTYTPTPTPTPVATETPAQDGGMYADLIRQLEGLQTLLDSKTGDYTTGLGQINTKVDSRLGDYDSQTAADRNRISELLTPQALQNLINTYMETLNPQYNQGVANIDEALVKAQDRQNIANERRGFNASGVAVDLANEIEKMGVQEKTALYNSLLNQAANNANSFLSTQLGGAGMLNDITQNQLASALQALGFNADNLGNIYNANTANIGGQSQLINSIGGFRADEADRAFQNEQWDWQKGQAAVANTINTTLDQLKQDQAQLDYDRDNWTFEQEKKYAENQNIINITTSTEQGRQAIDGIFASDKSTSDKLRMAQAIVDNYSGLYDGEVAGHLQAYIDAISPTSSTAGGTPAPVVVNPKTGLPFGVIMMPGGVPLDLLAPFRSKSFRSQYNFN